MADAKLVEGHYSHDSLVEAIRAGLAALGKTPEEAGVDDLAPVDEFHIGGRLATEPFLARLALGPEDRVLDVGCGLGGAARYVADRFGCKVVGVDLTADYVAAGRSLNAWVGLADKVELRVGNALALDFEADSFDKAYMMHVGMNIADKPALATELARVLRPGGRLGIYDIMRRRDGTLRYPVPWASEAPGCVVAPPEDYRAALEAAGFALREEEDRSDFALAFLEKSKAVIAAKGLPPLGIHLLMGEARKLKLANMIANVADGLVGPRVMIAEKR